MDDQINTFDGKFFPQNHFVMQSSQGMLVSIPNQALDMATGTIMYYLYKLANCPYGDNLDGVLKWELEQKKAFSEFIDRDDDATT